MNLRWRGTKARSWSWICRPPEHSVCVGEETRATQTPGRRLRGHGHSSASPSALCSWRSLPLHLSSAAGCRAEDRLLGPAVSGAAGGVWGPWGHGSRGAVGAMGPMHRRTCIVNLCSSWVNKKWALVLKKVSKILLIFLIFKNYFENLFSSVKAEHRLYLCNFCFKKVSGPEG